MQATHINVTGTRHYHAATMGMVLYKLYAQLAHSAQYARTI